MSDKFSVDADLSSVWVHRDGQCVARYGRWAYEIYDASDPSQIVEFGKTDSLWTWIDFKKAVFDAYGVVIEANKTPYRFHKELGLVGGYDRDTPTFHIPVGRLVEGCNPLDVDVWGRGVVSRERVRECIENRWFESEYVAMGVRNQVDPDWDNRRIAYLVEYPDDWPMFVEVIGDDGSFEIADGWHRLAAAVYRGDAEIAVALGGYADGWDIAFPERSPLNSVEDFAV